MRFAIWFWWAVHNVLAHPLLTLSFDSGWSERFHGWTAGMANKLERKWLERKQEPSSSRS